MELLELMATQERQAIIHFIHIKPSYIIKLNPLSYKLPKTIFLNKLGSKGDQGKKGAIGLNGPQGPPGLIGPKGEEGLKGDTGSTGLIGPRGVIGPKGRKL